MILQELRTEGLRQTSAALVLRHSRCKTFTESDPANLIKVNADPESQASAPSNGAHAPDYQMEATVPCADERYDT